MKTFLVEIFYRFYQFESFFFPRAVNPDQMAETLFKNCDTNKDGSISFQEFAMTLYFLTHASKEEKLKHIFTLLDADGNGTLSSTEVSIFCKLYVITRVSLIWKILEFQNSVSPT